MKKRTRKTNISTQMPITIQKAYGDAANGNATFMPYKPLMNVNGSTMVEIMVSMRMISLVLFVCKESNVLESQSTNSP